MRHWLVALTLSVVLCGPSWAYKSYQDRIPNGRSVPHPCRDNYLWAGVGHFNRDGGGARNPFGRDFAANGFEWNECICKHDSDGDGKTNGEELGDPNCVWKAGDIPELKLGLSHPGVCEPLSDPKCVEKNGEVWNICSFEDQQCDAISAEGVKNLTLSFPRTAVPAKETSYMCMHFDFPDEGDFHMIAMRPLIDNAYIMHHAVVFGCEDVDGMEDQESWKAREPTPCGMGGSNCRSIIGLWTVGADVQCLQPQYGFRLGAKGFKTLLLQFHWNNPEQLDEYTDASSMMIHYQPADIRQFDGGMVTLGPNYLDLPPRQDSVIQESTCKSACSAHFNDSIYIASVALHMHYLGQAGRLEHFRNGVKIRTVVDESVFSYDRPTEHLFDPPIEFQPGDELKMHCDFQTKYQSRNVYYGDATSAEMCFAFVGYYPLLPNFDQCTTYLSIDLCLNPNAVWCDWGNFFNETIMSSYFAALLTHCSDSMDFGEPICKPECTDAVTALRDAEPCLRGDWGGLSENHLFPRWFPDGIGFKFVEYLHACDEDWDKRMIAVEKPGFEDVSSDDSDSNRTPGKKSERPPPPSDGICIFNNEASGTKISWLTCLVGVIMACKHILF